MTTREELRAAPMTDKEPDELEALLIERAENLNDPGAYHGDIAEVMLKAADAIAALRREKAGLVGALRVAEDVLSTSSRFTTQMWTRSDGSTLHPAEGIGLIRAALKENANG